jgi:hypothetical protein
MEIGGVILLAIGYIISLSFTLVILIKAFQTHLLWGLFCLVPFAIPIFALTHFQVAGKFFLLSLAGIPFMLLGYRMLEQAGALM